MEQVKTIRLYGQLGAKFGRVHRLAVHSAKEAVKALCFTVDGFQTFLERSEESGLGYSVFYNKQSVANADLNDPVGSREIRIAPVIMGSKKAGMFQVIMGAAMVAAAVFTGGAGLALIASSTAWGIGLSGALMVAGGLFQVMSPQQTGLKSRQDAENKPSYAIGGAVNSVAMGNVIGLNYGTNEIGGAVISVGLVAENV